MKKLIIVIFAILSTSLLFSQADSRYDAGLNLPFNEKAGEVNPQSGNVTVNSADVSLPGRAGFNFSFSRVWNLNSSNLFNMDIDPDTLNNRLSSATPEKHYRMGTGWSSSIPYLHKDTNGSSPVLHLFFGGSAYQVNLGTVETIGTGSSNLIGYDLLDKKIEGSTPGADRSYDQFEAETTYTIPARSADIVSERSQYVLTLKDNSKYYFKEDGNLMMMQDPTGLNQIWYFYDAESKLTTVVDTIGRNIDFNYDVNGNLSEVTWKVDVWEKDGTGKRIHNKNSIRSVQYLYESTKTDYAGIVDEGRVVNYEEPFKLTGFINQIGEKTSYSYKAEKAEFSFNDRFRSTNAYLTLTSIKQNVSGAQEENYTAAKFYEYAVPSSGIFRKNFYTGFMEHYKVSRVYNHNRHKEILNDTNYYYFESNYDGISNQYSTRMEQGGIITTYYYSLKNAPSLYNVLTKIETTAVTPNYFNEQRSFAYDNNKAKVLEQVFRGSMIYQEEFKYDDKGNLLEHIDRNGLKIKRDYHKVFSVPISEYKTVSFENEEKIYQREWAINALGKVEKSILFVEEKNNSKRPIREQLITYDQFGNVKTVTDAADNVQHTEYDSNNIFPVYQWGEVSIDSYTTGTSADNWQTTPDTTVKVKVGARSIFNSNGTVYMQFDVEGNGVEYFYDRLNREIETVSPMDDDDTIWFKAILTPEIDTTSASFNNYLLQREDNPGSKTIIDDKNAFVKTEADIDKLNSKILSTGVQSDGLGNPEEEYTYDSAGSVRGVTRKTYDNLGRMIALTDPDAGDGFSEIELHGKQVKVYDKTWLIKYDDLGRQIKVVYPRTNGVKGKKYISYNDFENSVTTVDPENRTSYVRSDWAGNILEASNYGFDSTLTENSRSYAFSYDTAGRKRVFTDALGEETHYKYDERDQLVEQIYGSTGSDIMEYNNLGLLIKKTDRKKNVIKTEYDETGRPTIMTRIKPNGKLDETTRLSYNERGLGWRIEGKHLTEYSEFDVKGALVKHSRYLKNSTLRAQSHSALPQVNESYAFTYDYTDSGLLKSMTYTDGGVHAFDYENGTGYLKEISEAGNPFANNFIYNKSGVVESIKWENGVIQRWNFDNRKRISDILISRPSGEIEHLNYTLNSVGDVTSINSNKYSYNGFGEITGSRTLIPGSVDQISLVEQSFGGLNNDVNFNSPVTYSSTADFNSDNRIDGADHHAAFLNDIKVGTYDDEKFTYDKAGNRTSLIQNGITYTYHYIEGKRNQLDSITSENSSIKYEYDANGNTIKKTETINGESKVTDYEYDTLNRLIKTVNLKGTCEYLYDNANNRFVKNIDNNKTIYLRQGAIAVAMDIELEGSTGNSTVNRYVLSGDLIAGRISTKTTVTGGIPTQETKRNYYHLDHLNSTKVVTDKDANVVVKYEYRAFGEQLKKLNENNVETEDLAKYSYGGKELDDENDLYYFNARYYDATIGRFINVDPIQDGTNWYVYCSNNPLNFVDPTGLISISAIYRNLCVDVAATWQKIFKNSTDDKINEFVVNKTEQSWKYQQQKQDEMNKKAEEYKASDAKKIQKVGVATGQLIGNVTFQVTQTTTELSGRWYAGDNAPISTAVYDRLSEENKQKADKGSFWGRLYGQVRSTEKLIESVVASVRDYGKETKNNLLYNSHEDSAVHLDLKEKESESN